jgi:RimJ/RimL family protein N-acetyltransferase
MAALELPAAALWPPQPLMTERLIIRAAEPSDRAGCIDLLTSPQARRHLGGPLPLVEAEDACAGPHGRTPGSFVVSAAGSGDFVGTIGLERRESDRPGHLAPDGLEPEVSYVITPSQWRKGYATEAVAAVLQWAAQALPDPRVVACTQTANAASAALLKRLGFDDTSQRFIEFDAEQSLWVRSLPPVGPP